MAYKNKTRYDPMQWTGNNLDAINAAFPDVVYFSASGLAVYNTFVPLNGWIVLLEEDGSFVEVKDNTSFGDKYQFTL